MGSISVPTAILGAGVLSAGASVLGSSEQASAAQSAANNTMAMFNANKATLAPWVNAGAATIPSLQYLTGQSQTTPTGVTLPSNLQSSGSLLQPFQPTMAQLVATPGYQFTLGQGLEATQSGYAALGLGTSGAAQKGAAQYAEGLASTTYQQQFQNYWTQLGNQYNMLTGLSNTGVNAAGQVAGLGANAASTAGNFATSGASASAAGLVGAANSLGGAAVSSQLTPAILASLGGSNGLGGSSGVIDSGTWNV